MQPILQQEIQGNFLFHDKTSAYVPAKLAEEVYCLLELSKLAWLWTQLVTAEHGCRARNICVKNAVHRATNSHPEDPDALECCKVSPVMKVPH